MTFTPKTMLVTGGAGFIGSYFVRQQLKNHPNLHLINLDKLTYAASIGNLQNLDHVENYHFIQGDICDAELIKKIFHEHNPDTIVHFAAESHVDRSITGPAPFIETNIIGTFNLLEAARYFWLDQNNFTNKDCRFHHISTDEVYGTLNRDEPAFTEQTAYAPNSPYSASKASSDHLVRAYFHTYGLPTTLSNCSNNYGPYQHPEKFIPTIINSCINSNPIPVYGDGSNIRDWLHVADHCEAIDVVLQRGSVGETYNIGGDTEQANIDIAKLICRLMDDMHPQQDKHESLITFVEDRLGHDWRYAIDSHKIQSELSWMPQHGFKEGLRETIEFYLNVYKSAQIKNTSKIN